MHQIAVRDRELKAIQAAISDEPKKARRREAALASG